LLTELLTELLTDLYIFFLFFEEERRGRVVLCHPYRTGQSAVNLAVYIGVPLFSVLYLNRRQFGVLAAAGNKYVV
jgi:hypothetical protein